ncbi:MAG: FAD-dependent monooxygenase [Pseudomonadota bacterium]
MRVAIAGAGIGGLTAALAFARQGAEVNVYEASPELGEVGAGIQLSPNAMKALASLGVDGEIEEIGFAPNTAAIRHWRTNQLHLSVPLSDAAAARWGAPYLQVHRADLHSVLSASVTELGAKIHLASPITEVQANEASVVHDHGEADLLIGADGLRSRLREVLNGPEAPRYTGQTAWRALVTATPELDRLIPRDATVWAGPGAHVVAYYLRGGSLINLVAVEEVAGCREESWTREGDPAQLRETFRDWAEPVTMLLDAVESANIWALYDRPRQPSWTSDRIALLGDAVHPMLPFLAQGAAQAIEDAVTLAHFSSRLDLGEALQKYENLRKPRATMVQRRARANAGLFHRSTAIDCLKLAVAGALPQSIAYRQFDPIYGYDPPS